MRTPQCRIKWLGYAGLVGVVFAFADGVRNFWHYLLDDAYITLRYSRFLAEGYGPYFNHGEHVEGYTNFLFMVLLALVIACCGPEIAPAAGKALSASFGALTLVVGFLLVRRFLRRWHGGGWRGEATAGLWALAAATVLAISPAYVINSTSGLETTLLALGLAGAVLVSEIETDAGRWRGSGLFWAAAVLTRPEGSLLFAVHWSTRAALLMASGWRELAEVPIPRRIFLLARRRPFHALWINAFLVTSTFLAHMTWRFFTYDGELLPNTYYAKAEGFMGAEPWSYIAAGLLPHVLGIPGLALAAWGLWRHREAGRALLPTAVLATVGCLLPVFTGSDWMFGWRLVVPYLPLAVAVAVSGWSLLLGGLTRRRLGVLAFLLVLLVVGVGTYQDATRKQLWHESFLISVGFRTGHRVFAEWLGAEEGRADGPLALMDIGLIGYHCMEREIVDIVGLTNRYIAKQPGPFMGKQYDPAYIIGRRPAYVALLFTRGISAEPVPPLTSFKFWVGVEGRIYRSSEFQKHCVRPRREAVKGQGWLESLARKMGAVRVFPSASYPGSYYALAVFRCQFDEPGPGDDPDGSTGSHPES